MTLGDLTDFLKVDRPLTGLTIITFYIELNDTVDFLYLGFLLVCGHLRNPPNEEDTHKRLETWRRG